jgi:hypothetical protein
MTVILRGGGPGEGQICDKPNATMHWLSPSASVVGGEEIGAYEPTGEIEDGHHVLRWHPAT